MPLAPHGAHLLAVFLDPLLHSVCCLAHRVCVCLRVQNSKSSVIFFKSFINKSYIYTVWLGVKNVKSIKSLDITF